MRGIPPALTLAGAIVLVLAVVHHQLAVPAAPLWVSAVEAAAGLAAIVVGRLVATNAIRSAAVPWATAGVLGGVILVLLLRAWTAPTSVSMTCALIILTLAGPLIIRWWPFLLMAVPVVVACAVDAQRMPRDGAIAWTLVSIGVALLSALLMGARMRDVVMLTAAIDLAEQRAALDPLTQTLTRHGLELMLPGLVSRAVRQELDLHVTFIDVDDLKGANERHGHEFGDVVLRAVADAIRASVRGDDVVIRWGGDEFLVVGLGDTPVPEALAARVKQAIRDSGMYPRDWAGTVSVGVSGIGPNRLDIERLTAAAYADMFARRTRSLRR